MGVILDPKSNKLIIRFRVREFDKQFYLSTGLKDNKSNRAIVDSRWELIQREISLGIFDPTLERYKFKNNQSKINNQQSVNLSELWNKFTSFKQQSLAQSTIVNYLYTATIIEDFPVDDEVAIRRYLLEKYSYISARRIIADLSRCHDWAVSEDYLAVNNFKPLKLPKLKKSSREEIAAAFTLAERDLIINGFEHHHKFNHYTQLIKFLFWTGCRPGESFALTWGDISPDCTKITISKAYASRVRQLKGTKNNKRRIFPAAPGGKLQSMLLEMRSHHPKADELVFKSMAGQTTNSKNSR